MAGGGVEADERAAQVEPGQQVRQHGGLAALVGNAALRQDQAASRREGADEMQRRLAPPAVEGSAQRLAIDGDLRGRAVVLAVLLARDDERPPRPSEEALLELSGVDQHQHALGRVVRRDAPRQLQEAPEPRSLGAAVERDVLEALGVGQHRAHRDRQHIHQPVLDLGRRTRVRHAVQAFQKLQQHDILRADAPGDRTAIAGSGSASSPPADPHALALGHSPTRAPPRAARPVRVFGCDGRAILAGALAHARLQRLDQREPLERSAGGEPVTQARQDEARMPGRAAEGGPARGIVDLGVGEALLDEIACSAAISSIATGTVISPRSGATSAALIGRRRAMIKALGAPSLGCRTTAALSSRGPYSAGLMTAFMPRRSVLRPL